MKALPAINIVKLFSKHTCLHENVLSSKAYCRHNGYLIKLTLEVNSSVTQAFFGETVKLKIEPKDR